MSLLSCTPKTPAEKLNGKWSLDVNCTLAADPELSDVKPAIRAQMSRFVSHYLETVFFTFEKDGVFRLQRNHLSETQYYRITAQDQASGLSLHVSEAPSFTPTENMRAEFQNDGLKLTWGKRIYCLASN